MLNFGPVATFISPGMTTKSSSSFLAAPPPSTLPFLSVPAVAISPPVLTPLLFLGAGNIDARPLPNPIPIPPASSTLVRLLGGSPPSASAQSPTDSSLGSCTIIFRVVPAAPASITGAFPDTGSLDLGFGKRELSGVDGTDLERGGGP